MSKTYNKKVKPRTFKENDLVLKKIFPSQKDEKGEFAPYWEGLFMVKKVLSGGALLLQQLYGFLYDICYGNVNV